MSSPSSWLDRLNAAVDYRELQQLFSEIVAQAEAGSGGDQLAHSIDEAIRRLEHERARDEAELGEIRANYDSFKQENQGVVGWFKRHIPFTETRKQEVHHQSEVADQQAEILADNLVIARAQMIKERFLPSANRKLGRRPHEWQLQLEQQQSVTQLAEGAATLKDLAAEVTRSQAFLKALKADVEAFAGAHFASDEDRRRRDADLAAARHELSILEQEAKDETSLKQSGLKRLGGLVCDELLTNHAAFREDCGRLESLRGIDERWQQSHAAHARLVAAAGEISALAKTLQGLPGEIKQLRDASAKLEGERMRANSQMAEKQAVFDQRRARYEEGSREVERTGLALQSANQFYAAYRAEQQVQQTMSHPVEVDATDSPVARQVRKAQMDAEIAQQTLREATPSYEAARKEAEAAKASLHQLDADLADKRSKLAALEQRGPQLRHDMSGAADRAQSVFTAAASSLATCLSSLRSVPSLPAFRPEEIAAGTHGWLSSSGLERSLVDALCQAERDHARHLMAVSVLDHLAKWHNALKQTIDKQQSEARSKLEQTWKWRCQELLGDSLVAEVGPLPLPRSSS